MTTSRTAIVLGASLLCALVAGWLYHRHTQAELRGLRADVITLERRNSEVTAANAAQRSAIDALTAQAERNEAVIAEAAAKISEGAAKARNLEHRLREATNAQKYRDFQYSRDVSRALCLRWLNAEDRLSGTDHANDAGSDSDGRDDPVAAFCAAWPQLTAEEAVIYIGDLIDHAGRQKIKMRAARAVNNVASAGAGNDPNAGGH